MSEWHGKRALLNLPGYESTAAIVAEIEDTGHWEPGLNGDGREIDRAERAMGVYCLQFANCDRSITFDIGFGLQDGNYDNTMNKLGLMIDCLQEFRKGVKVEHRRFVKRMKAAGLEP